MCSFASLEEYLEVKEDIEHAFNTYSMPVKYTITAKKYDNTERGDSPVEKMLGIIWNLEDDTIIALPRYNLYGSSRVKELGPFLKDQSTNL